VEGPGVKANLATFLGYFIESAEFRIFINAEIGMIVGHLPVNVDDTREDLILQDPCRMVEPYHHANSRAVLSFFQAAKVFRQRFRQHGDTFIRHVDGTASSQGFFVYDVAPTQKMGYIGNVNPKPEPISFWLNADGVIKIERSLAVDSYGRQM
jgi:hypothetical protein